MMNIASPQRLRAQVVWSASLEELAEAHSEKDSINPLSFSGEVKLTSPTAPALALTAHQCSLADADLWSWGWSPLKNTLVGICLQCSPLLLSGFFCLPRSAFCFLFDSFTPRLFIHSMIHFSSPKFLSLR